MDLNKDQMLSFEELKLGLHKFGQQMPDADVQTLMEAVSLHSFPLQHKLNLHPFNIVLEFFCLCQIPLDSVLSTRFNVFPFHFNRAFCHEGDVLGTL